MIAALLLAGLLPGQSAPADPLAPAREGKLRCIAPKHRPHSPKEDDEFVTTTDACERHR